MIKIHYLKIKNKYLMDIEANKKTFELRKNDRDYKIGDLVIFHPVDSKKTSKIYVISYILKNTPEYGLAKNYCIFGIAPLSARSYSYKGLTNTELQLTEQDKRNRMESI